MDTTRRVRHQVAGAVVLMAFSFSTSAGLAGALALLARLR
jgi:hypothetical protein